MRRLRQVAFATRDFQRAVDDVHEILGIDVAFNDPAVEIFGLRNAVFPIGRDFIEVVSPLREGTSAGRYLDRCGDDAGYMLLGQCHHAIAQIPRVEALGVRSVFRHESDEYSCVHYHPRDCGGFLLSMDSAPDESTWVAAGPDWQEKVREDRTLALAGLEFAAEDPARVAGLWSRIYGAPGAEDLSLVMDNAVIRFVDAPAGSAQHGARLSALEVTAADPEAIRKQAERRGCVDASGELCLLGTRLRIQGPA